MDLCSFACRYCQVRVPRELLEDLFPGPVTLVMERSEELNKDLNPFTPVSQILAFSASKSDSFKPLMPFSYSLFLLLHSLLASEFLTMPLCWTWPKCLGDHLHSRVPTSAPRPVL